MADTEFYAQNPSVVLDKQYVDIPAIMGEIPGSPETPDDIFGGMLLAPPVPAKRVMDAALSSGGVMSVAHAVAQGTTGVGFEITARGKANVKEPASWTPAQAQQHDALECFQQAGYRGESQHSLRAAFHAMEMDRIILGWGGIGVVRSKVDDGKGLPPPPIALSRFQACFARFTRVDRTEVITPVPVNLADGRTLWVEVPRFFRRLAVRATNNRLTWYKEFGDWRSMDAKTGRYSTGNRAVPSPKAGQPGKYMPGKLPAGAVPAMEVMHFSTAFPGMYPYGISGWHAELNAVDSAAEHVSLLLAYLKSGLHSVIIAAANRKFDDNVAQAAIQKIDDLGRGRTGMGSLVTISLVPQDSAGGNPLLGMNHEDDRGRLILHELSTKLPEALLDDTLSDALEGKISHAERIPGLLVGRSDNYNFATAAAAWATANRLRFMPHHMEHETFLDALLVQMGITEWRLKTISPEWEESEPLAGIASVAGQLGGVSVNRAMALLAKATGVDVEKIDTWWGDIPMPIVVKILEAPDPQAMLDALEIEGAPKIPPKESVAQPVVDALKSFETKLEARFATLSGG